MQTHGRQLAFSLRIASRILACLRTFVARCELEAAAELQTLLETGAVELGRAEDHRAAVRSAASATIGIKQAGPAREQARATHTAVLDLFHKLVHGAVGRVAAAEAALCKQLKAHNITPADAGEEAKVLDARYDADGMSEGEDEGPASSVKHHRPAPPPRRHHSRRSPSGPTPRRAHLRDNIWGKEEQGSTRKHKQRHKKKSRRHKKLDGAPRAAS